MARDLTFRPFRNEDALQLPVSARCAERPTSSTRNPPSKRYRHPSKLNGPQRKPRVQPDQALQPLRMGLHIPSSVTSTFVHGVSKTELRFICMTDTSAPTLVASTERGACCSGAKRKSNDLLH